MTLTTLLLALPCALFFAATFVLFVLTNSARGKLRRAGLPAPPEQLWTYNHDVMISYIEAALAREDPTRPAAVDASTMASRTALGYYADRILPLDIAFAVVFAVFIAYAALLGAIGCSVQPWAIRACLISGCFGFVYGVADVGEDIKLRSIFLHAIRVRTSDRISESQVRGTALADAAEVDAANALTRVKIATLAASVIGLFLFGIFKVLGALTRWRGGPAVGARIIRAGIAETSSPAIGLASLN